MLALTETPTSILIASAKEIFEPIAATILICAVAIYFLHRAGRPIQTRRRLSQGPLRIPDPHKPKAHRPTYLHKP